MDDYPIGPNVPALAGFVRSTTFEPFGLAFAHIDVAVSGPDSPRSSS